MSADLVYAYAAPKKATFRFELDETGNAGTVRIDPGGGYATPCTIDVEDLIAAVVHRVQLERLMTDCSYQPPLGGNWRHQLFVGERPLPAPTAHGSGSRDADGQLATEDPASADDSEVAF